MANTLNASEAKSKKKHVTLCRSVVWARSRSSGGVIEIPWKLVVLRQKYRQKKIGGWWNWSETKLWRFWHARTWKIGVWSRKNPPDFRKLSLRSRRFFLPVLSHQVDEIFTDLDGDVPNSRSRAHNAPRWSIKIVIFSVFREKLFSYFQHLKSHPVEQKCFQDHQLILCAIRTHYDLIHKLKTHFWSNLHGHRFLNRNRLRGVMSAISRFECFS